ncbi:MAG: hypothetical protein ACKOHI_01230, partial [Phycisphaerales bacterium]
MARRFIALATVLAAALARPGSAHAQAGPAPEQAARVDVARGEGERLTGELARLRARADELRRAFDADRTRVRMTCPGTTFAPSSQGIAGSGDPSTSSSARLPAVPRGRQRVTAGRPPPRRLSRATVRSPRRTSSMPRADG